MEVVEAPRDVVDPRHAQFVLELPHLELKQLFLFLLHTCRQSAAGATHTAGFMIKRCVTVDISSKTTGNGGCNAGQAGCNAGQAGCNAGQAGCMELLRQLTS